MCLNTPSYPTICRIYNKAKYPHRGVARAAAGGGAAAAAAGAEPRRAEPHAPVARAADLARRRARCVHDHPAQGRVVELNAALLRRPKISKEMKILHF